MPKFKAKASEIEAEKIGDLIEIAMSNWASIPEWVKAQYDVGNILFGSTHLVVTTAIGSQAGNGNEWLVFKNGSLQVLQNKDLDADYEAI
jgi:hypothetical protein